MKTNAMLFAVALLLVACGGGGGGGTTAPSNDMPISPTERDAPARISVKVGPPEFGSIWQGTKPVEGAERIRGHVNPSEAKFTITYKDGTFRDLIFGDYHPNLIDGVDRFFNDDLDAFAYRRWRSSTGTVTGLLWFDRNTNELGAGWIDPNPLDSDWDVDFGSSRFEQRPLEAKGRAEGAVVLGDGKMGLAESGVTLSHGIYDFASNSLPGISMTLHGVDFSTWDEGTEDLARFDQEIELDGTHAVHGGFHSSGPIYLGTSAGSDNSVVSGNAKGTWGGILYNSHSARPDSFGTISLREIEGRPEIEAILMLYRLVDE